MNMASQLKFFFDAFSQPSRSVWLLLEANSVPFTPSLVNIATGDNRTNEEFIKVSPNKTVPAIDDNGFCLFESSAIMKYLVGQYQLPDYWYPSDINKRAKIDEYLSWHTGNLRIGAAGYMFTKYIQKRMLGIEPDEKKLEEIYKMLKKSIDMIDKHFLKETPFISSPNITIADIQAICEFSQFWIADLDMTEDHPGIKEWMDNCKKELSPKFDEVHAMVYLAKDKGVFKET